MAAQQDFDKTEEATPHKLREGRKKGQVAKSIDLAHIIILVSFFLAVLALWPSMSSSGRALVESIVRGGLDVEMTIPSISAFAADVAWSSIGVIMPVLVVLVFAAVIAHAVQTKGVFSTHPIKPDFNRLNPAQGFKKLFNRKTLFDIGKTILRLLILAALIGIGGPKLVTWLNSGATLGLRNVDDWVVALVVQVMLLVVLAMIPVVLLDWIFSKRYFAFQMKMSRREVKDELKRHEGSPEIRSKRKELQRELRKKITSLRAVKDADVIITNPVHVAVALRYVRFEMVAPVVVAVGEGELASTVRRLGRQWGKPILRRPALARKLARQGKTGQPIPAATYEQVAEVYRWLYQEQDQESQE